MRDDADDSDDTQDPVATPALLRLYLGQGHFERAQSVAATLLEQRPQDGLALALAQRCRVGAGCKLSTSWSPGKLTLRWDLGESQALLEGARLQVHIFKTSATGATPQLRELRCRSLSGKITIPLNCDDGACTSYLRLDAEEGRTPAPRILAVGRVHRWSRGVERRIAPLAP